MSKRNDWSLHSVPALAAQVVKMHEGVGEHMDFKKTEGMNVDPLIEYHERTTLCARSGAAGELIWVGKKFADMVSDVSGSLPSYTPCQVVPAPSGFLFWEKSPFGAAPGVHRSNDVELVDALAWSIHEGELNMQFYTRDPEFGGDLMMLDNSHWDAYVETVGYRDSIRAHRPDWVGNRGTEASMDAFDAVVATWLLMQQREVSTRQKVTPFIPRRAKKYLPKSGVNVSNVRLAEGRADTGNRRAGAAANHRWWVRGHWRQQACGPNRSQRRPVFIAPHTSGAKNGPLDDRPKVQRWTP